MDHCSRSNEHAGGGYEYPVRHELFIAGKKPKLFKTSLRRVLPQVSIQDCVVGGKANIPFIASGFVWYNFDSTVRSPLCNLWRCKLILYRRQHPKVVVQSTTNVNCNINLFMVFWLNVTGGFRIEDYIKNVTDRSTFTSVTGSTNGTLYASYVGICS
jgi:hypothetical protein